METCCFLKAVFSHLFAILFYYFVRLSHYLISVISIVTGSVFYTSLSTEDSVPILKELILPHYFAQVSSPCGLVVPLLQ